MARFGHSEDQGKRPLTRPWGGWTPSRGFWVGMATVGLFSAVLIVAGAVAAGREPEPVSPAGPTPTIEPVKVSYAPRPTEPPEGITEDIRASENSSTAVKAAVSPPLVDAANGGAAAVSATVVSPTPIASSWSSTPTFDPPAPAPPISPAAAALAADTEARFGVDIVLEDQDWGADEAEQLANIGAVASAMELVPLRVTSSVVAGPLGTLTVLSNREGRTHDGWKPYGGVPRSFYTNSDQGAGGWRPANQIVLATGSGAMTVAHEMLHAWTFRNVGPDRYVLALLGDEMRSFMAAAGWEQVAADDEVRASVHEDWQTVNSLFAYAGPDLTFVDQSGYRTRFEASNPLEAIASLGAIYYARPSAMPLPAWPGIWAWFDASLGPALTAD